MMRVKINNFNFNSKTGLLSTIKNLDLSGYKIPTIFQYSGDLNNEHLNIQKIWSQVFYFLPFKIRILKRSEFKHIRNTNVRYLSADCSPIFRSSLYQFFLLWLKVGDFSMVSGPGVVHGSNVDLVRVPLDHLLLELFVIWKTLQQNEQKQFKGQCIFGW